MITTYDKDVVPTSLHDKLDAIVNNGGVYAEWEQLPWTTSPTREGELQSGDYIVFDDGHTCGKPGEVFRVNNTEQYGLCVDCESEGGHVVDGQLDTATGAYIGIIKLV